MGFEVNGNGYEILVHFFFCVISFGFPLISLKPIIQTALVKTYSSLCIKFVFLLNLGL